MSRTLHVGPHLGVSFQRYPRPPSGVVDAPPTSWGALPIEPRDRSTFVIPVDEDEAIWLGLSAPARQTVFATVLAELVSGAIVEAALDLRVMPGSAIDGLPRPDSTLAPIARVCPMDAGSACRALSITDRDRRDTRRVVLLSHAAFVSETGHTPPSPRNADDIYRGWLLP